MTITPEQIAAYADGELDPARAEVVAAAIATNPELARQLAAHRALKDLLTAHYAPIAAAPLPDRLTELLGGAKADTAEIVDFTAAREARTTRRRLPGWSWIAAPALAASLALVLLQPGTLGSGPDYAGTELAAALDTRLSAEPATATQPQILLSFAGNAGEFCRAYAGASESGIACRDGKGWRIERKGAGTGAGGGDYRQAGSAAEELMIAAQDMASGPALDRAGEMAARARGWR